MTTDSITLIDPFLRDTTGHQLGYLVAIGTELQRRGMKTTAAVPDDTAPAALQQLAAAGLSPEPVLPSMRAFERTPAASLRWLAQSGRTWRAGLRFSQKQELWFINAEPALMGGISLLAERSDKPVLAHLFRWFDADGPLQPDRAIISGAVAMACRRSAARGRLALVGQTEPIAAHLQQMTGVDPVTVGPMVIAWPPDETVVPAGEPAGLPRVGFLGQARTEKGFFLLAEALELVSEPHRLELQASPAPGEPVERWQAAMNRLQESGATLYREPLTDRAYWALLRRLHVVALPYDPVRHAHRTSNILTEAIGAGAIPVVPADGWLGSVGAQHGAERFQPWTPAALAAAIDRAIRRAAQTSKREKTEMQEAWQRLHSAQGFVDAALTARQAAWARRGV